MIFKKGLYNHLVGNNIVLQTQQTDEGDTAFVYTFEDLDEPLILTSSGFSVNPEFKCRVILLNENNKAVVLFDSFSVGSSTLTFPTFDSVFLLTKKSRIVVEIPSSVSATSIKIPYAFFSIGTIKGSSGYLNGFSAQSCLMKRTFVSLPKGQKKLFSVKDFDLLFVSVKGSSPQNVTAMVNGKEYNVSAYSTPNLFDPLLESSIYEIENTSNYDFVFVLVKKVFNTETFLAYQYLLDKRILHMGIMLRNDFHNTMSKVYFGELPDIEALQKERRLLLLSDFNEANKGYYDDYEFNWTPESEERVAM